MTMTATANLSYADTMTFFGLASCDFLYNAHTGIDFTVYAQCSQPNRFTTLTPLFDYNNDDHVEAIKAICLAIVDNGFPDIHNITEVSGSFGQEDGEITFEGEVTTVLTGVCATIN